MAARSQWKGFLKLSLVSVPVKAYSATTAGSGIALNQLHAPCSSRIRYKKICPIHGEAPSSEIVMGYQYAKDQYVVIDTAEMDKLRTDDDKAINIDVFIEPSAFDPLYLAGKHYFLVPDGPVAGNAFHVIAAAMTQDKRFGIARVVFNDKEQVVLLRPLEGLLVLSVLNYNSQVSSPSAFEDEIPKGDVNAQELQLAKTLIKSASSSKFDMAKYRDEYTEKLSKLIEAKVAGQEIVSPPAVEPVHVINLMDALKKSVERMQKDEPAAAAKKPPRKMAPSKKPESQSKKRKSS